MKQLSFFQNKKLIDSSKTLRLIELFGGVGTQAMALERMGVPFESYRLIEFDKYPVKSYNAIHGTNYKPADITNTHIDDLGITGKDRYQYLMTYSFPCTDLSCAGNMQGMSREDWLKGESTRSGLLWEVDRILQEAVSKGEKEGSPQRYLPDILVMENVPQVHGKKNKKDFEFWLSRLRDMGYFSTWKDLNARDFDVPQNRNRCFCVSWLDPEADFTFPEPIPLTHTMLDCLEPEEFVDSRYYLTGERPEKLISGLIGKYGDKLNDFCE